MVSLVEHGRIKTTIDKAKEVRRHIEKAITVGKSGDLAARRLLLSRIANETAVNSIVSDIAQRMKTRPGGYTRIIKIGRRPGDQAEMAFLEFVDYQWDENQGDVATTETKKTATKAKKPAMKAVKKGAVVAKKKANAKRTQKKSRAAARA
jgi:large subunit ribosomal protein L17